MTATAVMKQTWALYRRLFLRSVGLAAIVFAVVRLLQVTLHRGGGLEALFVLVLSFVGTSLVQGGLVEVVRALHHDGDDEVSLFDALSRSADRLGNLLAGSILAGLGVGLAMLLLVVPGLVLLTRWSLFVPVVMLEKLGPVDALRRSKEIVAGHGWTVFGVVFRSGLLVGFVGFLFGIAGAASGPVGWWVALTVGSALTAPFAAHALTIVYYELTQPGQPVVQAPGHRWQSIWQAEDNGPTASPMSALDEEYQRRFDEHQRRWGGGA
jgi:hypothetical protein